MTTAARFVVFAATITLCHATCSNSEGRCSSFAVSRYPGYYLGCDSLVKTLPYLDLICCIRTCFRTLSCFSTNFKNTTNEPKCELLKSTRNKMVNTCFLQKDGWEHNEVTHQEKCGGETPCVEREALSDGWYKINGSTLKPVLKGKTWGEARSYCQSIGADLASISSETENKFIEEMLPSVTDVSSMDMIGHWKLDGTDPDVTLAGGARYKTFAGRKSLYLNGAGGTYVTVPTFDFTPEMTFTFWVRVHDPPATKNTILADWSSSPTFRVRLGGHAEKLILNIKNTANNDIANILHAVGLLKGSWVHLAITWSKSTKTSTAYKNGEFKSTQVSSSVSGGMTYKTNGRAKYDIGLKRDTNDLFKGYLKDLAVFRRVLTHQMVSAIYEGNYQQKGIWVGLTDLSKEGKFSWSDGSAVAFTNWSPGQPSAAHKLEDCVKSENSKWSDVACGEQLYFVCKKP